MPEIFINYRRNDSSGYSGRLADKLRNCFGENQIFRDYEALGTGVQFKREIQDAVLASSIVLVIIGTEWTKIETDSGKTRLADDDDFVRFEIELALSNGIPVIPVLVDGAQMPVADILPKKIKKLSGLNAHHLTETHWDADIALLIKVLESKTGLDVNEKSIEVSQYPFWLTGLTPLLNVIPDFLSLFRSPIKFLRKRSFGRPKDLVNALLFFTMIVIISDIFLYISWEPEHRSFWGFIFLGIPFWMMVTLLISVPMWLSWWLVGAREHYQRTIVILFYQMAIFIIIFFTGSILIITGMKFQNPDVIQSGLEILKNPEITNRPESVIKIFQDALVGVPAFIASGIGIAVFSSLPFWLIFSWGSYRFTLNRPQWATLLAFPIFIVVFSTPLIFLIWLN